jgi:hypothetical protein
MDTEVFAELTKKNPPHVEMRIVSLLLEYTERIKKASVIRKSTLWYQKRKTGSRQKNQIYNTVSQNQAEQKGEVTMCTRAATANDLW